MPGARYFKKIARTIRHLTFLLLHTWSITSLGESAQNVRQAHGLLSKNPECTCKACGSRMTHPTLKIFDAAQAFEAVRVDRLKKDISYLLALAKRTRNGLVAIYHSVKAITAKSHGLQRTKGDRT
eukprot:259704-Karenia_brevis.AAC.1